VLFLEPEAWEREMERHVLTADRGDTGVRLDLVLLRYLGGRLALSRRRLQAAIEQGRVSVNAVAATKAAARVAAGDRIDAWLPVPQRREAPRPQPLALELLFEDEHLLAVNKPPGIVVHPSYKHPDATLFNAVLWHVGVGRPVGQGFPPPRARPLRQRATARPRRSSAKAGSLADVAAQRRPRLLHRLDKDTSGVVLVSKTKPAHAAIVRAMRAGAVRKEYLAVVQGVPRPASGTIALKLRRDPSDTRRVAIAESEGKESVTRYETLSVSGSARPSVNPTSDTGHRTPDDTRPSALSLVRCELVTGRMHQIRVHLAARGWPIVGDRVYGCATGLKTGGPTFLKRAGGAGGATEFPRQALHAWRVSLSHPVTGAPLVIVAPVPDDMRALIEAADLRVPPV
jgi:23S rRNA pseudouridine1911/1915/1917 synthase